MYRGALHELNRKIEAAQTEVERRRRLLARVKTAGEQQAMLQEKVERLRQQVDREQHDVDRLEGKSLAAFISAIVGTKEARLAKERREVLAAKLKLDDAVAELEALAVRVTALETEAEELAPSKEHLATLLAEKESWVRELGGAEGDELLRLSEERAPLEAVRQEASEAVAAGTEALAALADALRSLEADKEARGRRRIYSLSRPERPIEDIKTAITRAQQSLFSLEQELGDVELRVHEKSDDFDFPDMTTFADLVIDDLVKELEYQDEESVAQSTIVNAHERVSLVVEQLEERRAELDSQIEEIDEQRQAIMLQWD